MARFNISANIIVEGKNITSKKAAINELRIMLDDYDDMNSDYDNSITINYDNVTKEKVAR